MKEPWKRTPAPIVIGYWTDDEYQRRAENWIRSLDSHYITWRIHRVFSMGSYLANVLYKPLFILDELRSRPHGRPRTMIYADVDMEIVAPPVKLFRPLADISMPMWEDAGVRTYFTGLIQMRNNPRTIAFLTKWAQRCAEVRDKSDQYLMNAILRNRKTSTDDATIAPLPLEYFWHEPSMRAKVPNARPVIIHNRASGGIHG